MGFIDEVRNELNKEQDVLTDEQRRDINRIVDAVKVSIMKKVKCKDLMTKNGERYVSGSINLGHGLSSDDFYYMCSLPGQFNSINEHDYNGIVSVKNYKKNNDICIEMDSRFILVLNEAKRLLEKEHIIFNWELSCDCKRVTGIIFIETSRNTFCSKDTNCLVIPKEWAREYFFSPRSKSPYYFSCYSSLYCVNLNFYYKYNV